MDERDFVIIKRERETPTLAMCRKCEIKFFTPRELTYSPTKAAEFLLERFRAHRCKVRDISFA